MLGTLLELDSLLLDSDEELDDELDVTGGVSESSLPPQAASTAVLNKHVRVRRRMVTSCRYYDYWRALPYK
tara:strand:- start:610 stop:822 length:213 start_codon:yes stop_codon:yes gene_type:complete